MGVGAAALVVVSALYGGGAMVAQFTPAQWLAAAYLGAGGGALAFFLWVYALQHASPKPRRQHHDDQSGRRRTIGRADPA
jgi:drug/metabolite transporter (DMT)-like permease